MLTENPNNCCKVKYFFIDFRSQQSLIKIQSFLQDKTMENSPVTEYELISLMSKINQKYSQDIAHQFGLRNMIDALYRKSKVTHWHIMKIIILFSIIPWVLQIMSNTWEVILVCNSILFVFSLMRCRGFRKEIRMTGFRNFVFNNWFNLIDISTAALMVVYVPIRLAYIDIIIPNIEEVKDILHFTVLMFLNSTITLLLICKLFHAIKLVDGLNIVAILIVGCVNDLLPFFFFLVLSTLALALLRIIVGVEV